MDRANGAFLETLRESVLTPRVVWRVVGRALELATAVSEDPESRRQPIQEELRQLDVEIARYTDAVGRDEPLPSLLEALRARERRRRELQAQIQELEGMARLVEGSGLGAKLTDWQGLLERQPIQARQLLRKLLVGPADLHAAPRRGRRLLRVHRHGLVRATAQRNDRWSTSVVPPAGSDRQYIAPFAGAVAVSA